MSRREAVLKKSISARNEGNEQWRLGPFQDYTLLIMVGKQHSLQWSPINHTRLCTAPTNRQENVSGAESDFSAEQKIHCIPTGFAWQICELLLSRGGALYVGIPEWLSHLRKNQRQRKHKMGAHFTLQRTCFLWLQIRDVVKAERKYWHFASPAFSRSICIRSLFLEGFPYMPGRPQHRRETCKAIS